MDVHRARLRRLAVRVALCLAVALPSGACGLLGGPADGAPDPDATAVGRPGAGVPADAGTPGPADGEGGPGGPAGTTDPGTPSSPGDVDPGAGPGGVAQPTTDPAGGQADVGPVPLGPFPVERAREVSGIAASAFDPDLLWLLDDGPGTTSVLAVRTDGTVVAEVTMADVEGRDTEALAIGPCAVGDVVPCLFVGDIGDNRARRESVVVHRFPEPRDPVDAVVAVTSARFTVPGGPVDAESMVVGADGLPVVLTKEPGAARILAATAFSDGALELRGTLPIPNPATPLLTLFTGVSATDASLSPDGRELLVRTYDSAVRYTAPEGTAGLADLPRWVPREVPVQAEPQGEAITWAAPPGLGPGWVTASEGTGRMWFVADVDADR